MVKVKGPLFSLDAHGKIANELNYFRKKTGSMVRKFHYPKKPVTGKQWTQRHIIGMITARWQVLSTAQKLPYKTAAAFLRPPISGFNYFVRVAQADLKTHIGLVVYYSMNETSGAVVYDYSGEGNNGILKPTHPANCPARKVSFSEQYGNALEFDGSDDYVECPGIQPAALTYMFWMKIIATVGDWNAPLTKGATKLGGLGILLNTADKKYYSLSGVIPIASNALFVLGRWAHICVVLRGDTGENSHKLYVNGLLDVSGWRGDAALDPDKIILGRSMLAHGSWADKVFKGKIDEVVFFNRTLTVVEIKKHYNLLRLGKKRQGLLIH